VRRDLPPGHNGQVYLGCRFAADSGYAAELARHGDGAGLQFDAATGTGVVLHMLGCLAVAGGPPGLSRQPSERRGHPPHGLLEDLR